MRYRRALITLKLLYILTHKASIMCARSSTWRKAPSICAWSFLRTTCVPDSMAWEVNHAFIINNNSKIPDTYPAVQSNSTSFQYWLCNAATAILISLESQTLWAGIKCSNLSENSHLLNSVRSIAGRMSSIKFAISITHKRGEGRGGAASTGGLEAAKTTAPSNCVSCSLLTWWKWGKTVMIL